MAHLNKQLSRFSGTLDVNHAHTLLEGNTLLNLAARCGAARCCAELLRRGAAVDTADAGGFTPLINAAWRGDAALARALLHAGADACAKGASRGRGPFTAAEWARARGHAALAETLLSAEAQQRTRSSSA